MVSQGWGSKSDQLGKGLGRSGRWNDWSLTSLFPTASIHGFRVLPLAINCGSETILTHEKKASLLYVLRIRKTITSNLNAMHPPEPAKWYV